MPGMAMEIDQLFIDMMIPHHASIVAMAQAALDRLEDERLRQIAQRIIETQSGEIEELRGYRAAFYGDPEPMPMDETMGTMDQVMPGMPVPAAEMMAQMDAATQVALFCAAEDPDLAFIDLTIPHHESAIAMAEATVARATHEEIRAFAERVIRDQQAEIEDLTAIRQEIAGAGTPEPASSAGAASAAGPVADQASLVDALRARGLTVDVAGSLVPDVPFAGAQSGTVLRVGGGALAQPIDVQVYEYADPGAAAADAGQITPDGNHPTAMITWIGPPHFFLAGRAIVLYVGADQAATDLMTDLLGPQFAGR
jgi:uncharacterized protein (DUF305 family)